MTNRQAYYRYARRQGWCRDAARILATEKTDANVATCLTLFRIIERRKRTGSVL